MLHPALHILCPSTLTATNPFPCNTHTHMRMQFLLDTADTPFERGSSRVFRLPVADSIGPLRRVHIEKQMSQGYDPGRGWYLKQVLVENPVHGERVLFPCNSWLGDSDCGGYKGRWWAPPLGLATALVQQQQLWAACSLTSVALMEELCLRS